MKKSWIKREGVVCKIKWETSTLKFVRVFGERAHIDFLNLYCTHKLAFYAVYNMYKEQWIKMLGQKR